MYHFIYKVTNLVNGMMYIGAHSTENINDGYLGSGANIIKAIEKFGKENFRRDILQFVDTQDELFELEREIVNEDLISNPWFYNKRVGGNGGTRFYKPDSCEKIGEKTRERWNNMSKGERDDFISKIKRTTEIAMNTDIMKEKIKEGLRNRIKEDKEKQYANISKGLKKKFSNFSEVEMVEFRERQKKTMSNPEVRERLSQSLKNSEKVKGGYENPDFVKRWKPRYDSIQDEVLSMALTDMFDIDIVRVIKNKYGFGVKIDRLFKYYLSCGLIDIIEKKKIRDYNTYTNVYKSKTFIRVRRGNL